MKREELKNIIPDITDEQMGKILDINSADIGKAKGDYDKVKADLDKANGKIGENKWRDENKKRVLSDSIFIFYICCH